MHSQDYKKVLRRVAKKYGVSVREVKREIELALKEGQGNPDPAVRAMWASIPSKGELPNAAETITHIADKLKK